MSESLAALISSLLKFRLFSSAGLGLTRGPGNLGSFWNRNFTIGKIPTFDIFTARLAHRWSFALLPINFARKHNFLKLSESVQLYAGNDYD